MLFIAFFLLVAVSVGATIWGLRAQAREALAFILAGRQRLLVQQMAQLANDFEGPGGNPDQGAAELRAQLLQAAGSFSQILQAFQTGGQQLQRLEELWRAYRAQLLILSEARSGSPEQSAALESIQAWTPQLLTETDLAARLLQAGADRRSRTLVYLQVLFLAGALALLAAGAYVSQRSLLAPLQRLGYTAQRLSAGDLEIPVETGGPQEFQLLSESFENLRVGLQSAQQELLGWTQTLEACVERRNQELQALYEVSRDITSRLELDEVLNSVVEKTRGLLHAERALLCLLEAQDQALELQATSGPPVAIRQTTAQLENPFVQTVLNDASERAWDASGCAQACGILDAGQRASHLAAPLWAGDKVIGALCVASRQPKAFSPEAPALLRRLANVAAIALENARLYQRAERMAALEERQRIAAEMHDGLAQVIDSLGLMLDQAGEQVACGDLRQACQTLERARRRASQASGDVRLSIASLQDKPPPPKDLQTRLGGLLAEFSARETGGVDWQAELAGSLYLVEADAQQVLGVAREALLNARRHSGAGRIRLCFSHSHDECQLVVEDDGCGFEPPFAGEGAGVSEARAGQLTELGEGQHDARQHFGLKIMAARAAQLGGALEVRSAAGHGTQVRLGWSLRRPNLLGIVQEAVR